jgi:4-coumarate--CoA ligase
VQHTEIPRAYVVLKPGIEETEARAKDIIEWLNAKVAPPKEVPKSQAGKILRRVLKEQAKKEDEAETPKAKL